MAPPGSSRTPDMCTAPPAGQGAAGGQGARGRRRPRGPYQALSSSSFLSPRSSCWPLSSPRSPATAPCTESLALSTPARARPLNCSACPSPLSRSFPVTLPAVSLSLPLACSTLPLDFPSWLTGTPLWCRSLRKLSFCTLPCHSCSIHTPVPMIRLLPHTAIARRSDRVLSVLRVRPGVRRTPDVPPSDNEGVEAARWI